jgi:hypothetical protein
MIIRTLLIISAAFILGNPSIYSQDIINTEKYEFNLNKKLNFGTSLNFNAERGNTYLNEMDAEVMGSYTLNRNIFRTIAGFNYLESKTEMLKENYYLQLRYNRVLGPYFQTFSFYQLQRNDILLVNKRELLGSGIRIVFFPEDTAIFKCDIGIGAMYENEVLNLSPEESEPEHREYFRMSDFVSLQFHHKRIRIVNVLYYQPRFADFGDFRVFNDLSLQFKILNFLSISSGIVYKYDSVPPEDIQKEDFSFKNGIVLKF